MTDASQAAAPEPASGPPQPKRRLRSRTKWIVAAALLSPAVIFAIYTFASLSWDYSEGERAGVLQKFSRKGWLCKTYEGEIAMVNLPGQMANMFQFTVRNDSIADLITKSQGKRVVRTYEQHKGVPFSCFGDTEYFVNGIRVIGP